MERARLLAGEMKAVARYIVEESRSLALDFIEGSVSMIIRQIADYDRPLIEDLAAKEWRDENEGGLWRRESIFPVERRWALVWEEVEENLETARRIREDPEGWVPLSYGADVRELNGRFLEFMKEQAGP